MIRWFGCVATGLGRCAAVDGLFPAGWYPGSLNLVSHGVPLRLVVEHDPPPGWEQVDWLPILASATIGGHDVVLGLGNGDIVEVAARVHLRTALGLVDGDLVELVI